MDIFFNFFPPIFFLRLNVHPPLSFSPLLIVHSSQLMDVFDFVFSVEEMDSGDAANLALLKRPELGVTFTKLHAFNLTQYQQCVFLDADTLVLQNADDLFDRYYKSTFVIAHMEAMWTLPLPRTWAGRTASTRVCFSSSPRTIPTPLSSATLRLSAVSMVRLIYFMIICTPILAISGNRSSALSREDSRVSGGDQGLLNTYFSWWSRSEAIHRLPFTYNMTANARCAYASCFVLFLFRLLAFQLLAILLLLLRS